MRQKNQEMKVLMDQMRNLLWDINAMLTMRKWPENLQAALWSAHHPDFSSEAAGSGLPLLFTHCCVVFSLDYWEKVQVKNFLHLSALMCDVYCLL